LVFIDYEKAFDSIDRSKIWSRLSKLKISPEIVNRIKHTHETTTNCVKTNMGITKCGVILSPILFNVVMNEICLKMKEKTGDLKALAYADNVMIWGKKIKVLEDKVN
jgi:retron-type reverse transcriptase